MNTISILSKYFQKYISISGLSGTTYTYKARSEKNYPIVIHKMNMEKCKPGSWLYIAVAKQANLMALKKEEQLYIGSQTQDRMFRGDGLKGKNFHHQEMRNGNGLVNLEEYLEKGNKVEIYVISKNILEKATKEEPSLKKYEVLISDTSLKKYSQHPAYWYEQIILSEENNCWAWNSKGADNKAFKIINNYVS